MRIYLPDIYTKWDFLYVRRDYSIKIGSNFCDFSYHYLRIITSIFSSWRLPVADSDELWVWIEAVWNDLPRVHIHTKLDFIQRHTEVLIAMGGDCNKCWFSTCNIILIFLVNLKIYLYQHRRFVEHVSLNFHESSMVNSYKQGV